MNAVLGEQLIGRIGISDHQTMFMNEKTTLVVEGLRTPRYTSEHGTAWTFGTNSISNQDPPLEINTAKESSSLCKEMTSEDIHCTGLVAVMADVGMNTIKEEESSECPSCVGSEIKLEIEEIQSILDDEAFTPTRRRDRESVTMKPSKPGNLLSSSGIALPQQPPFVAKKIQSGLDTPEAELGILHESLARVGPQMRDALPCRPIRRTSLSSGEHSSLGNQSDMTESQSLQGKITEDPIPEESIQEDESVPAINEKILESGTSAIGDDSYIADEGMPPMSAEELESFVMARIPVCVKQQLTSEAWKSIFSAASESLKSNSSGSGRSDRTGQYEMSSKGVQNQHDEPVGVVLNDDLSSVVSAVTNPHMDSVHTQERPADYSINVELSKLSLPPHPPPRFWDEGRSTHRRAPQLPRRQSCPVASTTRISSTGAVQRFASDTILAKPRRNVDFGTVQVRHYERVLDVNPSTSSGPSVGLGWRYMQQLPVDLDSLPTKSTDTYSLIIPRHVREQMLRDSGYTSQDIAKAVRKSLRTKNQRKQTYNNLKHERVEYLVEKSKRKVGRLLRFRSGSSSL